VTALKAALVLVAALVAQAAVVSRLDLFGAHGDLLILVPVAAGLTVGAERGAVAGFVAGLAVDLLVTTPFGLTALTYCIVGYAVGAFQTGVLRASWWVPVVAAVGGAAVGTVLWALAGTVVGLEGLLDDELLRVVGAVTLVALALVVPAVRLARWVEGDAVGAYAGART
jgi:rod shape-determining protein MreD